MDQHQEFMQVEVEVVEVFQGLLLEEQVDQVEVELVVMHLLHQQQQREQ
jgi:hypothetical protein